MLLAPTVCLAGAGGTYTWIIQSPLPEGKYPSCVSAADSTHVWAVGNGGLIMFYNGTTLTRQASGMTYSTTYNLNGVHAVDSTHVWAVGDQGTILFYNGTSWAPQGGTTAYDLESVWGAYNAASGKYNVWAVCDGNGFTNATILFCTGTGTSWSWKVQQTYPSGGLADITGYDTSHVWAVDCQTYYYTTPVGHPELEGTWSLVNNGVNKQPYVISACSVSDLWSITWGGEVLKSTNADNGTTLTWESAGLSGDWPSYITALSNTSVWVAGWDGKISYYNGGSWTPQTSGTTQYLYDIFALKSTTNVYTVGNEKFLASTDGGTNWTSKTGGTTLNLNGVSAFDATHAWAVGDGGTIVYTSDGGLSWNAQVLPVAAQTTDLYAVCATSLTNVWAVGWNATASQGQILRSTNGTSWSVHSTVANAPVNGVGAYGPTVMWFVSKNATTGGQVSYWTGSKYIYYSAATSPLKAISMASTSVGYAVGDLGGIYKLTKATTNTWTQQGVGLTTENLLGVSALSTTVVWACGANGKILYTSNGGVTGTGTWAAQTSNTNVTLRGVSAADTTHIWAVGDSGTIQFSDGTTGGNWTAQTSPKTVQLNGVDALNLNNAWAVGAGGTILFADPPYIQRCYPTWGNPGETEKTVEVVGAYTHFNSSSVVDFGPGITYDPDDPADLKILDYTVLRVRIDIAPGATPGPRDVSVVTGDEVATPLPGGFTVGPLPAITGTEKPYGLPGWTGDIVVTGSETHFDLTSQAGFGDGIEVNYIKDIQSDKATTNITIAADAALGARDVNIVTGGVETPAPLAGGFTVGNPVPAITSVDPASGMAGGAGFTLTVNGSNFVEGAAVNWNGKAMATTFVSSKKLTATINAADIPTAGIYPVTVTNPSPCSAASNPVNFTVSQAPQVSPVVNSVSPSSGPPGTQVTITGSGFGNSMEGAGIRVASSSYISFNGVKATRYIKWSDTEIVCIVPEGATPGPVMVVVNGITSNATKTFTVTAPTWYLAEGSTAWGFSTYITVENPNESGVTARLTYMNPKAPSGKGIVATRDIKLPPASQTSVDPRWDLDFDTDFSTKVECLEGKTIAVDRTMYWTGKGAACAEAHSSVGVTSPAKTWYLPEGSSAWGFECWLLVQNPGGREATCSLTYMIEGAGPRTFEKKVKANSRASFNMADDIGAADASIKVESNVPVIPERAMYKNNRREGHDSIGTTTPARTYYLAEGTTNYGFTTYVLIQNPNGETNTVTVTYMTKSGAKKQAPVTLDPNSRKTIKVNEVPGMAGQDFSTAVAGTRPLIAERAMYWNSGAGEACHDSIGMAAGHKTFYLPDGRSSGGYETYTLVQNPNPRDVTVKISYLTPTGKANVSRTEVVPAGSRRTYSLKEHSGIEGKASVVVTSTDPTKKVICERAMYWNSRGAGTDTIGAYAD